MAPMDPFAYIALTTVVLGSLFLMVPSLRESVLNCREGFSDVGYPTTQLCEMPLTTPEPREYGPADASIKSPKVPYHLLGDYMKPAKERVANLTSECAYIADGQRYIEKTGFYGQVTNNYRHKNPDNGTTWLHELSVSFYS